MGTIAGKDVSIEVVEALPPFDPDTEYEPGGGMDEIYLLTSTRHIELNPVRAGLVNKPESYPWSSALAHKEGKDDIMVKVSPLLEMVGDWQKFLSQEVTGKEMEALRLHARTGRPLGSERFMISLEATLGRLLRQGKPGPKPKETRDKYGVPGIVVSPELRAIVRNCTHRFPVKSQGTFYRLDSRILMPLINYFYNFIHYYLPSGHCQPHLRIVCRP